MSTNQALAVAVAAFGGHNPNIIKTETMITAVPRTGPSDLELAIDELLFEEFPNGTRIQRVHPTFAARELAAVMTDVAIATLASVGHRFTDLDSAAIAEHLRTMQRAVTEGEFDE